MLYVIYFKDNGTPKTGLSPTIDIFVNVSDGLSAGTPPTVTELSGGGYKFDLTPTQDIFLRVDSNDVAMSDDDRYKGMRVSVAEGNHENTYNGTGYDDPKAPATQEQIGRQTATGAPLNQQASGYELTTGTQTANTWENTVALDNIRHTHTDDAGALDLKYTFNIGGNGRPASTTINAILQGGNDAVGIYAYNWVTVSWEQVGTLNGTVQATQQAETFTLFQSHVGTGANTGEVEIRFYQPSGLTTATLAVDQIFISHSIVGSLTGYSMGSIWVDTVNGVAGSEVGVNGVADNAVSNWADALLLSAATSINRFQIAQGSSLTFTEAFNNKQLIGLDYVLNLNGQDVSASTIEGANLFGTALGATGSLLLRTCQIAGAVSLPNAVLVDCAGFGDLTLAADGIYIFKDSFSAIAGAGAPNIIFGSAGAQYVSFRMHSGGNRFLSMSAGDTLSLEGFGQFIIDSSCTGGSITCRGFFTKTDEANEAVAVSDDARFDTTRPEFGIVANGTAQGPGAGAGNNQIQLSATEPALPGNFDPATIFLTGGTGAGQTRRILHYDTATRTCTVKRAWKTTPDATTRYMVRSDPGEINTNEGLTQGGTASTVVLNDQASAVSGTYVGQTVFITSGPGEDESGYVVSYDGPTRTATINKVWRVIPTSDSAYAMLPTGTDNTAIYEIEAGPGSGSETYTHQVTEDATGNPVPHVKVWLTTVNDRGAPSVATAHTDTFGNADFFLDPGTYYLWRYLPYWSFAQPIEVVIGAG